MQLRAFKKTDLALLTWEPLVKALDQALIDLLPFGPHDANHLHFCLEAGLNDNEGLLTHSHWEKSKAAAVFQTTCWKRMWSFARCKLPAPAPAYPVSLCLGA